MKIDTHVIRKYREQNAWSQEHLADLSGLGLRTIQRIESSGSAALESVKAIATALGIPISDLVLDNASSKPQTFWFVRFRLWVLAGLWLLASLLSPPDIHIATTVAFTLWVTFEVFTIVAKYLFTPAVSP